MAEQTNLFSQSHTVKKNPTLHVTNEDKAYQQLVSDGLAKKYHIYPAKHCLQIIKWQLSHGSIVLDDMNSLYKELKFFKKGAYYHMASLYKIYQYNAWLMMQVDRSLKGQDNYVERH